eukprot:CAMPEP_0201992818 /NCGR_PEP_ID=MMETSP0905-20130828/1247_1 /ASSEMBLY_ACC=CAM_ASM_000554 /TAXON_ID=420261 /ORGANISM="Thalassiosira antarctica, Strain CCMP982" /LENGTH=425 /DNA_ID=CAMNT_0048547545 /DNA_START=95 /DNA_END=1369 /DNA_ORIENTATION=-
MKQIVPGLFRRRNNNKAATKAAAAVRDQLPGSHIHDFPSISVGRVSAIHRGQPGPCSAGVIGVASGTDGATATVSTLTNDRSEATMKMSEQILQDDHKISFETGDSYDVSLTSSRYESNDRGIDQYSDGINKPSYSPNRGYATGINKHRYFPKYSPKGVDEFESTNMYKSTKCDSRKEVRFRSESHGRSNQVFNDDARTNQSSSLFHDDNTRTNQSSSLFEVDTRTDQSSLLFDDDTRTNQSSSIFHDEAGESYFDEVTLGSTTLDEGGTNAESESYLTSLDDGNFMSYVSELDDDGDKQRRKYQLGVGQNATTSKLRKGVVKTTSSASEGTTSTRRRVTVHAPRGHRGKSSTDDADLADDVHCPLLPDILEEVSGSYLDAKSALNQVLYAFFVSPDDIDRVADKLRDAKLELVEMYQDQLDERW